MLYYEDIDERIINAKETPINIIEFINKFMAFEKSGVLVKTFTEGFCYYFTLILKSRFPEGHVYYSSKDHFVFKLEDRLYDITGDCTEEWDNEYLYDWEEFQRIYPRESKTVLRDTIMKNEVEII